MCSDTVDVFCQLRADTDVRYAVGSVLVSGSGSTNGQCDAEDGPAHLVNNSLYGIFCKTFVRI
jgi:hypothetical protein